jgi:glucose/arabinose dehydrogenase
MQISSIFSAWRWRQWLLATLLGLVALAALAAGALAAIKHIDWRPTQVSDAKVHADAVIRGLDRPWGLAFLPDGRMLITLMAGEIRVFSAAGQPLGQLGRLPAVADEGQGGLLDITIDPDYPRQPWIYWTYAEPGTGQDAGLAGTALARGRLTDSTDGSGGLRLGDIAVIYRQQPKVRGSGHFGSRLVFDREQRLFMTLGERQQDQPAAPDQRFAQNLSVSLGKVVRLTRDGAPAPGNPIWPANAGQPAPLPEIWSLGHRNPQGAALHPLTGALWETEHGPQGGDELNVVKPGANHGWPVVSYGCPYGSLPGEACRVAGGRHKPPFVEPLSTWVPWSTAPSGLAFYTSDRFPAWKGHLFAGSLKGQTLWDFTLDGEKVVSRKPLLANQLGRIRDVRQGPDGHLYVLVDGPKGRLMRVGLLP